MLKNMGWSHLPNASHIDSILASVKAHPEQWAVAARAAAWSAAWDTAQGAAYDAAQGAVRGAAWLAARDEARSAARSAACLLYTSPSPRD